MVGTSVKAGTINAGDLDINKDVDSSKLKISGTASRDNVLYVLMTTEGGGSDGDSKLAVFNVSQDWAHIYKVVLQTLCLKKV